jgi:hypothetical protein
MCVKELQSFDTQQVRKRHLIREVEGIKASIKDAPAAARLIMTREMPSMPANILPRGKTVLLNFFNARSTASKTSWLNEKRRRSRWPHCPARALGRFSQSFLVRRLFIFRSDREAVQSPIKPRLAWLA